uniref:DUF4371 domain-containing protein n=1 Tax=Knipowitschia caucasica TaxID=637954 RepID=A0AAV2JWF3_KNICA
MTSTVCRKDFFEFIPLQSATSESIAAALSERLAAIIPEDQKSKLICQVYDGASVMRGANAGVQRKIKDVYPNAHYFHCYAHQLNLIMQQATSHISKRDDLIQCFENIRDSGDFDSNTIREAGAMAMLLEHQDFKFFLELFHHIMPLVDLLYAKLQKKNIDAVHIKGSIQQFEQDIQNIRNSLHSMSEQSSGSLTAKRRQVLSSEDRQSAAEEICNTILRHTRERFNFTDHLVCATLLQGDRFEEHHGSFPEEVLQSTLKAYPMLNGSKLKTELSLIYSKAEFRACCGAVDLFQLFMENNLQDVFFRNGHSFKDPYYHTYDHS